MDKFIVKRRKVGDETVLESLKPNKNEDESAYACVAGSMQ